MLHPLHVRLTVAIAGLRSTAAREDGQALVEYALILALIALVAIAALTLTGTNISSLLNTIATDL
jgi:pilus assembly protein Flp/PilA